MFSSDMGKIIELQGQYIDRVNRNAAKLNKQLQFLVNIGEQIGGAAQKDEAADHTNLITELKKQDEAISKAMADQKIKTDELSGSIKSIIESYATLKTSSGSSNTKVEELMTYLNDLKLSNTKKLKDLTSVTGQLDDAKIKEALQNSSSNTVEPKSADINTKSDTDKKGTDKKGTDNSAAANSGAANSGAANSDAANSGAATKTNSPNSGTTDTKKPVDKKNKHGK